MGCASLSWPMMARLKPHPSHETKARRMGHPEIQLRSFGRCGRVGHPPVNGKPLEKEELFGLSSKAIDRWIAANRLENDAPLVRLVKATSEKLFFLAEKSQELVSDAYATLAAD